ncbi:hypothetical protein J6590_086181 [Homalodisca vitripennis]|nr:hypothetical protein J6590_086181 [Homalodisca vitripennis]
MTRYKEVLNFVKSRREDGHYVYKYWRLRVGVVRLEGKVRRSRMLPSPSEYYRERWISDYGS